MTNLPPPTFVDTNNRWQDEIPDYIAGHLIYHDDTCGLPWVIYDGGQRHHFASRAAAARFAIAQAARVTDRQAADIMTAAATARQLSEQLGRIFIPGHAEITRYIAGCAGRLRAISDQLNQAAQYCLAAVQATSEINDEE